jgi:hypothetical protein
MSFEQPAGRVGEFPADIDMSNQAVWQYAPVWLGPAQNVTALASQAFGSPALVAQGALTTPALGILQAPVLQGEPGLVVTAGISKCLVATAITVAGGPINLTGGGCQPATTGLQIDGYAIETGPANAVIAVKLVKNGKA